MIFTYFSVSVFFVVLPEFGLEALVRAREQALLATLSERSPLGVSEFKLCLRSFPRGPLLGFRDSRSNALAYSIFACMQVLFLRPTNLWLEALVRAREQALLATLSERSPLGVSEFKLCLRRFPFQKKYLFFYACGFTKRKKCDTIH